MKEILDEESKNALINYRIQRAYETLKEAQVMMRESGLKVEHRVVQAADQRKHPHRERHVPLVFRTRTPRKQASVHPCRMFNQHCLAVRKVGHNLTTIEVPI